MQYSDKVTSLEAEWRILSNDTSWGDHKTVIRITHTLFGEKKKYTTILHI